MDQKILQKDLDKEKLEREKALEFVFPEEEREREKEIEKERKKIEKKPEFEKKEKIEKETKVPQAIIFPPPSLKVPEKSQTLQTIENILEEDLEEVYYNLDKAHQRVFKEAGEKTASIIEKLIKTAKATAKKVLELIKNWLRLIPGVNKFFLEQEAKIKTDKIITLTRPKT